MSEDPIPYRFVPTIPDNQTDVPHFGQLLETTKDAIVLGLREFARTYTQARRQELPNIEKYATPADSRDSYATFVQIIQDNPDIYERMPHIALTASSGSEERLTIGTPFIGTTQLPPRVETVEGPFAFSGPQPQVTLVEQTATPIQLQIDGQLFEGALLSEVARAVQEALDLIFSISFDGSVLTLSRPDLQAFAVSGVGVSITTTQNAVSTSMDVIAYAGSIHGVSFESRIDLVPSLFPANAPVTAATVEDVLTVAQMQALFARPRVVDGRLQLLVTPTPAEIEVTAASTRNAMLVTGLAAFGTLSAGAAISGTAPNMTLVDPSGPFDPAWIDRKLTLTGAGTNDGSFIITSITDTTVTFTNENGTAADVSGAEWFFGQRDTWLNPIRPVMNRYNYGSKVTYNLDIFAEHPTERQEITDLVVAYLSMYLAEQFYTFFGRGVFDENYPEEMWQAQVEATVTPGTESDRGTKDLKKKVFMCRVSLQGTVRYYVDREVRVPFGPRAGQSYALRPGFANRAVLPRSS